jgi:uncharacterized protein (TIGR02246 family)
MLPRSGLRLSFHLSGSNRRVKEGCAGSMNRRQPRSGVLAFELLPKFAAMTRRVIFMSMFRTGAAIAALGALVGALYLPPDAGSATPTRQKTSDSRGVIASSVNTLVTAWNSKNPDRIAGLFQPDAVLVMPSGSETRSRAKIRQRLVSEWQGKLKDSKLSHSVQAISLQGNEAVVKGRYRLDGVQILGFATAPEGAFVLRHKKQQGRWMIAKAEILRND